MNPEHHIQKLNELFSLQEFDEKFIDYSQLDMHIGFLMQLATVEGSSLSVFDIYKRRYVFAQTKFLHLLGVDLDEMMKKGPQIFYSLIHPDDVDFLHETHYLFTEFVLNLDPADRKSYKVINDFRMKDLKGNYLRAVKQMVPLELDKKGNLWLMLVLYDLIPGQSEFTKAQRKIVNIKTGSLYHFPDDRKEDKKQNLTKREIEILGLLARGLPSKKIADELFLSVNTVNNHRRNILEKTNTENTRMAIQYGMSLGLL